MKLILASDISFVLKQGYAMTGIPKDAMRIGYVTTASKVTQHPEFFEAIKVSMRAAGYRFEEFDIDGKDENQLRQFFSDKNVIHVEGGNTFYLLKAIRESGFAVVLKESLAAGKPYIGTSAGAYVMCPTIEVATWAQDNKDRFGLTDLTALNYVPFVLKAHYRDEDEASVQQQAKTLKYPLRRLHDGEGILIQ
jgi:dipeptidase E